MNKIFLVLTLVSFLSACSKNADIGNLPGTAKNTRPTDETTQPITVAELEWSLPMVAFPSTNVNTVREQVVTLKNKGKASTSPISMNWADASSPFSIKAGTDQCDGKVLAPNASCSITIKYNPLINGSRSNVVMATDLVVSKALILTGIGTGGTAGDGTTPAKIQWILDDYDFGPTAVAGHKDFDFILVNIGGTTSDLLDITFQSSSSPFSMVAGFNFCQNQTLAPGANCKVKIRLNPTVAGNFVNILKATDLTSSDDIQISGSGVVIPSQLVFNPTSYSFNQVLVGGQKTLDVKLRNSASVNSGVIRLAWANTNNYNIIAGLDQCTGQILPGGSECTIRIRFAPETVAAELTNTLTAEDDFSSAAVSFVGAGSDPASNNPVAINQSLNVAEDIFAVGTLTGFDPNGLNISYMLVGNPTKGQVVLLNANTGEYRYTPDMNQNGTDSFTFRVKNANNDISAVATIAVNINAINDAPVASNDVATVNEDSFAVINVLGNDTDVESNILSVIAVTQPANGVVIINGDNTVRYTPTANYSGLDSFTYSISDGAGGLANAVVNITVSPINDAPVANNSTFSLNEDSILNASMQGSDIDSTTQTYTVLTQPTHGSLVVNNAATGAFTYTPNANYHGSDSFTFKLNDGTSDSNTATVSITVNSVNDLPVADNSVVNVVEDTVKNFTLTAQDADGETLTYTIITQPSSGTLTGTAPNLVYTPNPQFNGMDVFTYQVNDGTADSNVATVNVAVWAVNDAPVAFEDAFSIPEDSPTQNRALTAHDEDGDTLTYTIVNPPTKGVLVLTNSSTGAYTYTPNSNTSGSDAFTFKVFDGKVESSVATVEIDITSVLDIPVANNMNIQTIQDTVYNGTFSFTNIESDPLNFSIVANSSNGTVTIIDPVAGTFTYTPNAGYSGADSFTYTVANSGGTSSVATVSVQVSSSNQAPVASGATIAVTEDVVFSGNLSATDADNNPLTYSIVTQGTKGVVTVNSSTGAYTYAPNLNINGVDTFTFRVYDGLVYSGTETITVNIAAVNDAPVADAKVYNTNEDTAVNMTLSGSDIENSTLTYIIVSNPTNGVLSGSGSTRIYTPNSNFEGTDSFTYKVNDGQLDSSVVTVTITVNGSNDAPVANNLTFTTNEDTVYTGAVVATDADMDNLNYSIVSAPSKGVVSLNPTTGALTYTPNLNQNGSDSFTYRVNDGLVNSNTATVSITITPVNDLPVANNQSISVNEDTLYSGTLTATDVEGSPLTYSAVTQPSNGVLVINANGSFTYDPNQDYNGSDSFTFRVNDGTANSTTATVSITVVSFNNLPVANNQSISTNEDTPTAGTLVATDVDGDTLSYSVVANGAKGTVVITNTATGAFTYTPSLNQNGSDAFTFRANDGKGNSNTATVTVSINAVNDAPVALTDSVSTNRNTTVSIILVGTDVESSPLTYTVVAQPTKGVLSGTAPNLTYTPNNNQTGADSFTFKVNDGSLDSATATISINIVNSNSLPVANNSSLTTNEDTLKTGNVTATDSDNDPLTYSVVNNPSKGTVTIASNGSYTYTPSANANGSDSFTFRANDGYGNSNTATVSVTITPVNDTPVANAQSVSTKQNTAKAITLTASDVDANPLTYTVLTNPTKGVLSGTAPNLTYTPNNNQVGADSFTFRVNDGTVNSNTATVSITIEDLGNWFNTNWLYRRKLHINNQKLGALTDVPVMVKLDSTRIDYAKTKAGGADIRFADLNGNLLSYEIERWNSSGVSTIWVKIPSIAANSTTGAIFMYYGNTAATDAQNKSAVWSNGYAAVYHLEETTGMAFDSTSNANNSSEVLGSVTRNISGKIAGAEGFATNSDLIRIPNSASLNITSTVSVEAWVYQTATNSEAIVAEKNASSHGNYSLRVHNGKPKFRVMGENITFANEIPSNKWTYLVGTFNTATDTCQLYSSEADTYVYSTGCNDNITSNTMNFTIGGDDSQSGSQFRGNIDEVRISNVERSSDWVQMQYQSQSDSLLVYGSEQSHTNALLKSMLTVIATDNDDGEVTEGGAKNNYPYMGEQSNGNQWGFFRFRYNTAIPSNATITNTRLRLYGTGAYGWNTSSYYLAVRGEKTSNAPQLTGSNQCPGCSTNKTTTTANTSWGSPGLTWDVSGWNQSSDLKAVTQELVTTYSGLSLNNYMQLWVTRGYDFSGTPTAELSASDYANFESNQAQLLIEWTVP